MTQLPALPGKNNGKGLLLPKPQGTRRLPAGHTGRAPSATLLRCLGAREEQVLAICQGVWLLLGLSSVPELRAHTVPGEHLRLSGTRGPGCFSSLAGPGRAACTARIVRPSQGHQRGGTQSHCVSALQTVAVVEGLCRLAGVFISVPPFTSLISPKVGLKMTH